MKLLEHQEPVVEFGMKVKHPAFFLDMRLGKTVCTFEVLKRRGIANKILIIAPKSCLPGWRDHLSAFFMKGSIVASKDLFSHTWETGVTITNYDAIRRNPGVASRKWNAVILDESTEIKNPKAKITKICTYFFRNAKHRFILSGLPAPESPLDYYTQFQFLHGSFCGFGNYWSFRTGLFNQYGYDWSVKKKHLETIKEAVNRNAYCLTRKQAGVENMRFLEKYYVEMTAAQKAALGKIKTSWENEDGSWSKWRVEVATWEARLAGGFYGRKQVSTRKQEAIVDLLQGQLKGEQAVIFFRFNKELLAVWKALNTAGISKTWITGSLDLEERDRRNKLFQAGKKQVMLAQIKCCKFGLNFSAANTAIYYSNSFSLLKRMQSMDRIVHLMKQVDLLVLDLITEGTIDVPLCETLREKKADARFFMNRVFKKYQEKE